MSEAWNDIARRFLEKRGFFCEAEPEWIPRGEKRPDFFCHGPLDLWVEVKSLSDEKEDKYLRLISHYFWTHAKKVLGNGSAMAYVAAQATEQDAKAALNLAKYALAQPEAHSHKDVWIVIPDQPYYGWRVSFSVLIRKGPIWLVSCKAKDGRYGYPFYLKPEPLDQTVEVISDAEPAYRANLGSLARQQRYRLALEISPGREPFRITAIFPSGLLKQLSNVKRIRKCILEANSQLKSGMRYKKAPGVIFVFQEGVLVPDDEVIFSALFGDLTVEFPAHDSGTGHVAFGKNSAWHLDQNRRISALTYFRNFPRGLPCTIRNPYACRPIPHGIFGGREWIPEPGSDPLTIRLLEHPT